MKQVSHRNVTLSLPEALLKDFKVFAAERNQSMTALAAEAIRQMMEAPSGREAARARMIDRMKNAKDRTNGRGITWTRDEIYER